MHKWKKRVKKYKKKLLRKKLFNLKSFLVFSLCFASFLFFAYFFIFSDTFQVKKIIINGVEENGLRKDLKNEIEQNLGRKVFYFLKTKSIFLADINHLEKDLTKKHSLISSIDLRKILPDTVVLEVKEKKPEAVYCSKNNNYFLLDKTGEIFKITTESFSQSSTLPLISLSENISGEIGKKIILPEEMQEIIQIYQYLKKIGAETEKFTLSAGKITARMKEGWEAYFQRNTQDIPLELLKLNLILKKELPLEKRKNLQYIELRFSKSYYK